MNDPDALNGALTNPTVTAGATTLEQIMARRFSRRCFVRSAWAAALVSGAGSLAGCHEPVSAVPSGPVDATLLSDFDFTEIEHGIDAHHHIASDHEADILIRWGDPLFADAPAFDPYRLTAAAQERQFGSNNDYIGFLRLTPAAGQQGRALLCVNHETADAAVMLPEFATALPVQKSAAHCEIEKAAVGCSIVEIVQQRDRWSVVTGSPYNRRISARSTAMRMTGPAAGHERLQTSADPEGRHVVGTLNNCAGGMTPWGTFLTCEENIDDFFVGSVPKDDPEAANHRRFGVPKNWMQWGRYDPRFKVDAEPREPNRFGWVVEIDPLDPVSVPKKRTALGRFKHEGAESVVAPDGRVVVYMGDDERFDYLYKFVTTGRYDGADPTANRDLLDSGVLYVARFAADGWLEWLPLVFGQGPLTAANGFGSQAEVLIETRRAGDLLGATPMDRPEDVQPNPATGRVYVMLSNNTWRGPGATDAANPRAANAFGHIIELVEPDGDFTALRTRWEILVRGGNPAEPAHQALWNPATSVNGWFASPDNAAVDPSGRLWVATDQGEKVRLSGTCDGLWALETEGPLRGTGRMFFRCPQGAELCGPQFSDTGESLFLAVQHPGESTTSPDAATAKPAAQWPDFGTSPVPRSAIVQVRRRGGGRVG